MSDSLDNSPDTLNEFEAALARVQHNLRQKDARTKGKLKQRASNAGTLEYYDTRRSPPPADSGAFSIDWKHKPSVVEGDEGLSEYQRYQEICEGLPDFMHPCQKRERDSEDTMEYDYSRASSSRTPTAPQKQRYLDRYTAAEYLRIVRVLDDFHGQVEKDYWEAITTLQWDPDTVPFPEDIHNGYQDLAIMLADAPDEEDEYAFDAWEDAYIQHRDEHRIRVSKMHEGVEMVAALKAQRMGY